MDESSESLPGTEQNMSVGNTEGSMFSFMLMSTPAAALSTARPWSHSCWGEEESWLSTDDLSLLTNNSLLGSNVKDPGLVVGT